MGNVLDVKTQARLLMITDQFKSKDKTKNLLPHIRYGVRGPTLDVIYKQLGGVVK